MQTCCMQATTMNQILNAEKFDKEYKKLKEKTVENEVNQVKSDFSLNRRGLLLHKIRLYIPNSLDVMDELHKGPY